MSDAMRALIDGVIAADPPPSLIEPHVAPRFALPAPRAAAVAIAALLAFGVMLGSFVSPAAKSAAQAPIVVAVAGAPAAAPVTPAPAAAPDHAVGDSAVAEDPRPEPPVPPPEPPTESAPEPAVPAPAPPKPLPVPPLPPLPSVSHVFVVMLSGHRYEAAFGPDSKATYLSKTLTTHGELIPNYYAVTHGGLANEIAMVAGQGPTKQTATNCADYEDVTPGTVTDKDQVQGDGCVYPKDTKNL